MKVTEASVEPCYLLRIPVWLKHEGGSVRPAHFTAKHVVKECNKEWQKSS